ncbi:FMN-binding negative transcriptional regulator [Phenylobacterium sp.]|uniref:FMN-binding negative transcriptional regulator n=1 Tax=Phenylobacterium sp. TaxID=1871053 RepID=UPI002E347695|nr:FMN-binding negative transcriptional regulator [Phenylobacterium sp.]HEX3367454.1 FMN-binding negative transcriptional regulator [Phenylobacterium sp.]
MSAASEDRRTAERAGEARAAPFEQFGPADVRDLIAEYPLASLGVRAGSEAPASLLPLLGDYDAAGRLVELVGHMARRNPLRAALEADPGAWIQVQGPQGYISPEQAGRRDWAPTWNYAQLWIEAQVTFTPEETGAAVRRLVETMEAARAAPWSVEELGRRYTVMEGQIIGFRARVTRVHGRFKLAQDEAPEIARAIIAATRDPGLGRWMTRFNADRL